MTSFLYSRGIRIFDYPQFALPLRERIRENAQELAAKHGATIEHIAKAHVRKEDVVAKVLAERGDAPGLVHVISAMETCATYKPWHDKASGRTFLRPDTTKCLHYYFYWMDRELGLIYVRVPTYCPFRLQVYCNGHSWLACRLSREGIDFATADNAFLRIADFARAQMLADTFKPDLLHRHLDHYAQLCCPVHDVFGQDYHWSIMQAEYSTDLVFKSAQIPNFEVRDAWAGSGLKVPGACRLRSQRLQVFQQGRFLLRRQGGAVARTVVAAAAVAGIAGHAIRGLQDVVEAGLFGRESHIGGVIVRADLELAGPLADGLEQIGQRTHRAVVQVGGGCPDALQHPGFVGITWGRRGGCGGGGCLGYRRRCRRGPALLQGLQQRLESAAQFLHLARVQ
jgi:hypothetical protein